MCDLTSSSSKAERPLEAPGDCQLQSLVRLQQLHWLRTPTTGGGGKEMWAQACYSGAGTGLPECCQALPSPETAGGAEGLQEGLQVQVCCTLPSLTCFCADSLCPGEKYFEASFCGSAASRRGRSAAVSLHSRALTTHLQPVCLVLEILT